MKQIGNEALKHSLERKLRLIEVAAGRRPAELVLKNAAYVNVFSNAICHGDIAVSDGMIAGVGSYSGEVEVDVSGKLVLPGLIDAHIHLESALVAPVELAKAVLPHGTTTVVTDPHEIANVMGTDGIEYMLQATEGLPVDVRFMLPSCVPATPMDESGAVLGYEDIDPFYAHPRVQGLAEMMNYPGVLAGDAATVSKLAAAQNHGKRIDGHAPGLPEQELNAYAASGVRSDHECYAFEDALAKLERGQFIMIREGTAARNLEALLPLLTAQYADRCMFCTDDKHPSDLLEKGDIDYILRKAVSAGVDPILAVKAASLNAARYFGLEDRGAIAPGYLADLVVVDSLETFEIEQVYRKGALMFDQGRLAEFQAPVVESRLAERVHDTFHVQPLTAADFASDRPLGLIGMVPGEIVSQNKGYADHIDVAQDILKIAVVERHKGTGHIGLGYIQGYGLKSGAVATSVAHDSHNIIVVGTDEGEMADAVNRIVRNHGGIVVVHHGETVGKLELSIGGIMSEDTLENVNDALENAKAAAFSLGVNQGIDPFMTLSFMSLPVIPALRLTTRGMVDVITQQYV
ncbi:MAG: adenine deaminase [Candidatus Onthomonas sp.]